MPRFGYRIYGVKPSDRELHNQLVYGVNPNGVDIRTQLMGEPSLDGVALLLGEGSEESMGTWLILVPVGRHFRRVGITDFVGHRGWGHKPEFTENDLQSKDHGFLQRTDGEFTARAHRRTLLW
jgi:hypothetical protein